MRILSFILIALLSSCYSRMEDSNYYGEGYNFLTVADSIVLQPEEPLLTTESAAPFCVYRNDELVVVTRETLDEDSIETWVRVARDQYTIGWLREAELLQAVVPNDPISIFIYTFSNRHLICFLSTIGLAALLILACRRMRHRTRMVHFDDIPTPFPTLMCIGMAVAAVLYACIQRFAPSVWQQFYFAPTLNPFGLHPLTCAFLSILWAVVLLTLATLDDVLRLLPPSQAMLYLLSTLAFCMGIYTLFSLAPLVWVAMPGTVCYAVWAMTRYFRHAHPNRLCGHCGKPIHAPGQCQWCGVDNKI